MSGCSLEARRVYLECVSWGRISRMAAQIHTTYCDEAWAILSPETLLDGKSPEGFDLALLKKDLAAVGA